jgi:uncharacterized protein
MSDQNLNSKPIKCPQCGLLTFYSPQNPFRPFCSERCRTIDLGEWASGKYSIPITSNERQHDSDTVNEDAEEE